MFLICFFYISHQPAYRCKGTVLENDLQFKPYYHQVRTLSKAINPQLLKTVFAKNVKSQSQSTSIHCSLLIVNKNFCTRSLIKA